MKEKLNPEGSGLKNDEIKNKKKQKVKKKLADALRKNLLRRKVV